MDNKDQIINLYHHDFASFIPFAFKLAHPGVRFLPNWHIDVLANALMKVWSGEETRLIINLPPRTLKSFCVSVAFVTWFMAKRPTKQILHISGNRDLKRDLEASCQTLLRHPRLRGVFPRTKLCNTHRDIILEQGGARRATVTYGDITGKGADLAILDDPMDAGKADDPKELSRLLNWVQANVVQRLNRPDAPIILVMQRLNVDDLTQQLLRGGEKWTVLSIPAIAQFDEKWVLADGTVFTRKRYEALHPQRQSFDDYAQIAQTIGARQFSAQYQQRPLANGKAEYTGHFVPMNKNPNNPSAFYRVSELDTLFEQVFGLIDNSLHVSPNDLYTVEEWEACAAIQQTELIAQMKADYSEKR